MEITIFDLETTGRSPYEDIPVSMAYLTLDKKGIKIKSGIMYFYKEGNRVSCKEAQEIHQLSISFLKQFESEYDINLSKAFSLISRGNLVGHNIRNFDLPIIRNLLRKEGYPINPENNLIDTLEIYRKVFRGEKNNLRAVVERLGFSDDILVRAHKAYFGKEPEQLWHSATFDVTATALIYLQGVHNKYVPEFI